MTEEITFSYAAVPPSARDWLQEAAREVRQLAYRTAVDMIRVGQLLASARQRLKRRTFQLWIKAELPWSRCHAYRLIAVAECFGPLLSQRETERIEPTALYLLARPEVPPEARACVISIAEARRVTAADARDILSAMRPIADPDRGQTRQLAPLRPEDIRPRVTPDVPVDGWSTLQSLVERSRVVHLSHADEDEDDDRLYSVTVYSDTDRPRVSVRRNLTDAILAAAGCEPEQVCPGCERSKPVGEFGANADMPGGRNRRCKECERSRLSALKKRRRDA